MIFTDQDLVFNGFKFSNLVYVEDIRTTLTPQISYPQQEIPGRTGVRLGKRKVGARTIEVDIRIIEDLRSDVTDVATEIAGRLMTDGAAKLVTRRDRGRWWLAVYVGEPDLAQFHETGFATLEFLAPAGTMYSDEVTEQLSVGENTVTVQGTYETTPVVTVTLADERSSVSVSVNNKTVTVTGLWPAGTVLRFDGDARAVWVNDARFSGVTLVGSRYGVLLPGSNLITVDGGAAELKYFPRWL